jgi:hypothetical protein
LGLLTLITLGAKLRGNNVLGVFGERLAQPGKRADRSYYGESVPEHSAKTSSLDADKHDPRKVNEIKGHGSFGG